MVFKTLYSLFSSDLAIDFGTHNSLIYAKGRGIVVSEPSIVAVDKNLGVIAFGREVFETLAHHKDGIVVVRPLKDGAIASLDLAEKLIQYFIRKAHSGKHWPSPRVVMAVPLNMTQVERHAFESCAYSAGASEVYLVEAAIAAAHGVGVPTNEPFGTLIVDIGGGTTDINVLSMGSSVYSLSIRVAGDEMDNSITRYVRRRHGLSIGKLVAQRIKFDIGSAFPLDVPKSITVQGRHLFEGELRSINVNDDEVREALSDDVLSIANAIHRAIDGMPPDLTADILERGIVLTGGGALLSNLDRRLSLETGLPVSTAEDPLASVVLGLGRTLSDFDLLKRMKLGNPLYGSNWEP